MWEYYTDCCLCRRRRCCRRCCCRRVRDIINEFDVTSTSSSSASMGLQLSRVESWSWPWAMTLNFSLRRAAVATHTHAESQGYLGPSGGQVSRQGGGRWFGPIGPPSTEHAHVDCWVGSRVNGTAAVLPVGRRGTTFDAGTPAPPPLPARLFFPTTPPPTQEAPSAAAAAVANSGRKQDPSALEVFLNDMRYINPRFTYLLTYLPQCAQ